MKFLVLAALCASTLAFVVIDEKAVLHEAEQLTGKELVDYVNSVQKEFTVAENDHTDEYIRSRVMNVEYAAPHSEELKQNAVSEVLATIPATFDSRSQWSNCATIKSIRDQTNCGSCWAFSTAEVMSDRTCIQSKGASQPVLAPEDVLTCCGSTCGDGCNGGYPIASLRWWASKGLVTGGDYKGSGCRPYQIAPCTTSNCKEATTPSCTQSCVSGYSTTYAKDKHFGASAYAVSTSVSAIQTEIINHGPVAAAFTVYEDFYKYTSGVYHHTAGKALGGHAIKLVGWGTESGTDYWLVANSWGTGWGEKGFFKIRRGTNECGIEHAVVAGLAK